MQSESSLSLAEVSLLIQGLTSDAPGRRVYFVSAVTSWLPHSIPFPRPPRIWQSLKQMVRSPQVALRATGDLVAAAGAGNAEQVGMTFTSLVYHDCLKLRMIVAAAFVAVNIKTQVADLLRSGTAPDAVDSNGQRPLRPGIGILSSDQA